MPLPALAAAALASPAVGSALGAVGNVIGGILGKSAQKSANKMNYKIAQETNAANERIADRANALQYKMQQEQFDYASPARQREMLEAAGMNPYLYASQSAHAGSAPSVTTGAPQVAAQMMPENAFANSVSSATREFAETFGLLMDAKKKQAETEGQQLSNSVYLERFKTEMDALGLGNEYQSIVNRWADRKEELTVDNLLKSGLLTDAQVEETKVRQALGEDELKHLRPKMLEELIEKVGLLKEQQLSEQNEREFRNITAKIGISNAATNRLLALVAQMKAPSEIEANYGAAHRDEGIAEDYRFMNSGSMQDARREEVNSRGALNRESAEKAWKENQKIRQQMDWNTFDKLVGMGIPIAVIQTLTKSQVKKIVGFH